MIPIFARYVSATRYEDIPSVVREKIKGHVLDTLAVTIAAGRSSPAQACPEVVEAGCAGGTATWRTSGVTHGGEGLTATGFVDARRAPP